MLRYWQVNFGNLMFRCLGAGDHFSVGEVAFVSVISLRYFSLQVSPGVLYQYTVCSPNDYRFNVRQVPVCED